MDFGQQGWRSLGEHKILITCANDAVVDGRNAEIAGVRRRLTQRFVLDPLPPFPIPEESHDDPTIPKASSERSIRPKRRARTHLIWIIPAFNRGD